MSFECDFVDRVWGYKMFRVNLYLKRSAQYGTGILFNATSSLTKLYRRKTDLKPRQALSRANLAMHWTSPQLHKSPQLPEKVSRIRSNSTSMTSPPPISRKRTSSGIFQVDESEPLAKKSEVSPSPPDTPRRPSDEELRLSAGTTYGRKKTDTAVSGKKETVVKKKDVPEKKKEKLEKINDKIDNKKREKVIQKFDSKAKSNCVTAFKESESWD